MNAFCKLMEEKPWNVKDWEQFQAMQQEESREAAERFINEFERSQKIRQPHPTPSFWEDFKTVFFRN